jgi:membrane protease subunit (stomatin/prohibitin family)
MKTFTIKLNNDEEKFQRKVTQHFKYKHLADIKQVYMDIIMSALATLN